MIRDILTNVTMFIDGRGKAGEMEEFGLPDIVPITAEIMAGGMAGKVDMPMGAIEKMTVKWTLNSMSGDSHAAMSFTAGDTVPVTVRGVLQDDSGVKHSAIAQMRATITKVSNGTWKPGEPAKEEVEATLRTYKLMRDGRELIYADPVNMILRVTGVDQLAQERAILGV